MEEININLLPAEDALRQKKASRFLLVQTISTALLLGLIFLTSATFALRVLQGQNISKVESLARKEELRVGEFKDKEAALYVLKNRLSAINNIVKTSGTQADVYDLVVSDLPPSVVATSVSIDKVGNVIESLIVPDGRTLDNLLAKFLDQAQKIEVESLSRGRDGIYRVNLKIQMK